MTKNQLMATTMVAQPMQWPQSQHLGGFNRMTRSPENDGTGGGGQDDGAGNGGAQNQDTGEEDYGIEGFKPASFWDEPAAKDDATGEKKPGKDDSGGQQKQEPKNQGSELAASIDKLTFKPAFSPEVIAELAEGKVEGVNNALQEIGRESTRQSVIMAAQLMQKYVPQMVDKLRAEIKAEMQGTLEQRDDSSLLLKNFPSAKDPAVRPIVEGVFKQSLIHTNGNREKAVIMAKGMLKQMGQAGGEDFGRAPGNPDDFGSKHPGVSSLVESLLGRD